MRNFLTLDQVTVDAETGNIILSADRRDSTLAMKREGAYMAISANHGPLEIALRPRFEELTRCLSRLQRVDGPQTTRQVGSGEWVLGLGLQRDGTLLMRLSIIADATGNISFNFALAPDVSVRLYEWMELEPR